MGNILNSYLTWPKKVRLFYLYPHSFHFRVTTYLTPVHRKFVNNFDDQSDGKFNLKAMQSFYIYFQALQTCDLGKGGPVSFPRRSSYAGLQYAQPSFALLTIIHHDLVRNPKIHLSRPKKVRLFHPYPYSFHFRAIKYALASLYVS